MWASLAAPTTEAFGRRRPVESAHAPLALLNDLRLEGPVTVPGHLQIERTDIGLYGALAYRAEQALAAQQGVSSLVW